MTNPSILILDEPTSGLDSTAANALIVTLRELANDRMTVISSIHQPSSKVTLGEAWIALMLSDCHSADD